MSDTIFCCGQAVETALSKRTNVYSVRCAKCGKFATGQSAEEAIGNFSGAPAGKNLPTKPADLASYAVQHLSDMAALTVPFIARDKPALTRLIKNNVRHIVIRSRDDAIAKVWQTKEGQESIVMALEEAMSLGAELGKTGSLVPFGGVVEFIPAVEAYEFALTNGSSPPFAWISIDLIHKNDICEISRMNGEFSCKVKPGRPRGALVQVAVYGYNNRLRQVIGELYDVDRLLAKAQIHSASYGYYLRDVRDFKEARTEGKVKVEKSGREYIEKEIPKRDGGGTWTKKIYADEITNPYEGADQPEMLRKAAGKSFLGKYARIRNSESAVNEMAGTPEKELERTIDRSIDAAFAIIEEDGEPQDAPDETDVGIDDEREEPGDYDGLKPSEQDHGKAQAAEHANPREDVKQARKSMDEPGPSLTKEFNQKVGKTGKKDELDIF